MESFKTVNGECSAEIVEKRSRFIATVRHVETEEQANAFIKEMREKYWDAKHNVFAYVLSSGNLSRFSDDGEPHGTAGKPVLDVINGNALKNTAIVVTRYFGGVLLGTGGLVRAYSSSALEGVKNADIHQMKICSFFNINCSYSQYDKLQSFLKQFGVSVISVEYETDILVSCYIEKDKFENFSAELSDFFRGNILAKHSEEKFFPVSF